MRDIQRTWGICLLLILGIFLVYYPVTSFGFVDYDDSQYVQSNFHLYPGAGWKGLAWCFQAGYGGNWIPLVWLSYMLDFRMFGADPHGYHIVNVILHAVSAVVLFLLLKRMTGAAWRSAMVAALFAIHPQHVESVAWISERKDVLSALFWFLTTWAYVKYAEKGGAARYVFVLALYALALMAKPMVVTLPFTLLLLDWWPLRRAAVANPDGQPEAASPVFPQKTWPVLVLEKIPLIAMALGASVLTVIAQHASNAISDLNKLSAPARLENALMGYFQYIQKTFWPVDLSVMYPFHLKWAVTSLVVAGVFLLAISDRVTSVKKKYPYALMGWLWYLGTLFPVIGLVQAGGQSMADRYSYIPSVGLFIVICWGAVDLVQWLKIGSPWALRIASVMILLACGAVAAEQVRYWKNSGTLFGHALAIDPDNYTALNSYGVYQAGQGDFTGSIKTLQKATKLNPHDSLCHDSLGHAYYLAGRLDDAADELRAALKLDPDMVLARQELGSVLLDKNAAPDAVTELNKVVQTEPTDPATQCLLGKALAMEGLLDEARLHLAQALRLNPNYPGAHYQLGLVLAAQNDMAGALAEYRGTLALQPNMPEALNNLAWILATDKRDEFRNGAEAEHLARRACELTKYQEPIMVGTLGAACAEAGDFDQAVTNAMRARDLANARGLKSVAAKNEELLKQFRARQPVRE